MRRKVNSEARAEEGEGGSDGQGKQRNVEFACYGEAGGA